MPRHEQNKCIPFDSSNWWGPEKYGIQNMLVREVHFPEAVHEPEDETYDNWSDRSPDAWSKAWEVFRVPELENTNYLAKLRHSSPELFLEFCSTFITHCQEDPSKPVKLDGARLVRYSDAGGYETYLLTGVVIRSEATRREAFDVSDRPPRSQRRRMQLAEWGMYNWDWDWDRPDGSTVT